MWSFLCGPSGVFLEWQTNLAPSGVYLCVQLTECSSARIETREWCGAAECCFAESDLRLGPAQRVRTDKYLCVFLCIAGSVLTLS